MSCSSPLLLRRSLATSVPRHAAAASTTKTGSIADVFASLSGQAAVALPPRFAELKQQLWREGMGERWAEVLADLKTTTKAIKAAGPEAIPRLPFEQIVKGDVDPAILARVKETGTVVIEGVQSQEEALQWKEDILDYVARNKEHVTGYPADNIQVFELYNTFAQRHAQTHANTLAAQRFLITAVSYASDPRSKISLQPIVYGDRLRIRQPGDESFKLGCHIDGGSLERWEDPGFRKCFAALLDGKSHWTQHDAYDLSPRIDAITDLYKTGNGQCSVLRPWQGWTSLSHTRPTEGTLKVYPNLRLSTAYVMLRPFFKPKANAALSLEAADWERDESSAFPGSVPGNGQEMNDATHPHLRLDEAMVSVPAVKPGDHVYWAADTIHAVESVNAGKGDSSVLYIPAVPLTVENARYLKRQAEHFEQGIPAPDFPQGQGESRNVGRAMPDSIRGLEARRALGLEAFEEKGAEGERAVLREANDILFG